MTEIDQSYRKQSIENFDVDLPYINLSFFDNLTFIKGITWIVLISAVFMPFLPPLHRSYNSDWTLPTSLHDYYGQIKDVFYFFAILFGLILVQDVLSNFRTFIDRRLGYKKIGIFEVKAIWNLRAKKFVFLNDAHFFSLTQNDYGFAEIKVGELVEIERSATHKFMDYQITK
jgi:hypothetical protein